MEYNYEFHNYRDIQALFGRDDSYVKSIEESFGIHIEITDGQLKLHGEPSGLENGRLLLDHLFGKISKGLEPDMAEIRYWIDAVHRGELVKGNTVELERVIATTHDNRSIRAKTIVQRHYIDAIERNSLTFALGPAGTGKTFLAVLMAVEALKSKSVKRIVLVRPAVEAGEQLGFLPGDLQEKIQPYIRPLYDHLYDFLGVEQVDRLIEKKIIEIAPLAYMRGRTLDDAFIILDEGQNATIEQMKMFLTRFGYRSKVVVTGDPSQNDLRKNEVSGLNHCVGLLQGIEDIRFITLTVQDVVRHPLVREIIKAYEQGGK